MDKAALHQNERAMDSILLELAAHRLNSINPPPTDLPDLLDNLLVSHNRLSEKIDLCKRMTSSLTKQIGLVHSRFIALNQTNLGLCKRSVPISDLANQDDAYRIYRTQTLLLQSIMRQLAFISWKFGGNLKEQLTRLTAAHHNVFNEFFGYRHEHAGIAVADSAGNGCVDGCDWYSKVGRYDWSKRPYGNEWWKEMNSTNWDWVRVREHIKNMVFEAWKLVTSIDMFYGCVRKLVPAWIWYEDLKMWELKAELVLPKDHDGKQGRCEVQLQVRFVKTDRMKQLERALLEQQQRDKWVQEGLTYAQAATMPVNVEIKTIGAHFLDWGIAFDGPAVAPDWNQGGQHVNVSSWLNAFGMQQWLDNQAKRKEASLKSNPTTQTE